ncbi:uncharacterized protein LOC103579935 [Microplitis demolitor]|uniref:uncharacterized protein LOC103579935 n=1 Tax=Microplitis demolitor TaxID=69319 RepID=UPI0006D4DA5A|nr:uncharacterized protein LOC103579935 [Microplitis demolitor]
MSIDIFKRQSETKSSKTGRRGPPGPGFKITDDGQFDIDNKRLCNIADPENFSDAIPLRSAQNIIQHEVQSLNEGSLLMRQDIDIIIHGLEAKFDNYRKNQRIENENTIEVISKLEMKSTIKEAVAHELHAQARRNYPRRHVDIRGIDETWQADLVDMTAYASFNKQHKFILTIIDNFSKFAWAVPLKTKNAQDVTSAMQSVLKKGRVPKNLHVDQGKEFYNSNFKALMQEYGINLYSTYSNLKASICERFNRTLKNKMWVKFTVRGTYKWIDILDDLVVTYNDTKHRTIKMKPKDVTAANAKELVTNVYRPLNVMKLTKKKKFKVGDKVRITKYKHVFEKGYTPNWTTEIFTIKEVKNTNPTTYKLIDYQDQPIEGGFYEEELSKVKYPDVYLVEKIIHTRGKELYVKWLGFDSTHTSWINKTDL